MHLACEIKDPELAAAMVEFLIEAGAPVSVKIKKLGGRTPLHFASDKGHTDAVYKLITLGKAPADVVTNFGESPLHSACQRGFKEVVEVLLLGGANPTLEKSNGATALLLAVERDNRLSQGRKIAKTYLGLEIAEVRSPPTPHCPHHRLHRSHTKRRQTLPNTIEPAPARARRRTVTAGRPNCNRILFPFPFPRSFPFPFPSSCPSSFPDPDPNPDPNPDPDPSVC